MGPLVIRAYAASTVIYAYRLTTKYIEDINNV